MVIGVPVHVVMGQGPRCPVEGPEEDQGPPGWWTLVKAAHKRDMEAMPTRLFWVFVAWFALWYQGVLGKSIVIQ